MICTGCRRTLLARISNLQTSSSILTNSGSLAFTLSSSSKTISRTVATVPASKNAAPATPPPSTTSTDTPPDAVSSATPGKTQPFSEPFFPSTTSARTPTNAPASPIPNKDAPIKLTSSIAGGTSLSALSYTKPSNTSKPLIALEDHEYPSWLWNLVSDPNAPAGTVLDGGVDVASMTKKSRAKFERKQAKLMAGLEKPIPLHEQSRDLTGPEDDAVVSSEKRKELTKSMRDSRRKGIREANFLRSM